MIHYELQLGRDMNKSLLMANLMQLANHQQMVNLLKGMVEKSSSMHSDVIEMKKLIHENWKLGPLEVIVLSC